MEKRLKELAKHSIVAMLVSPISATLVGMLFILALRTFGLDELTRKWDFDAWYMPLLWWPGLVLGFFRNRRALQIAACFTWVLGLLWLCYPLMGSNPPNLAQARHYLFPTRETQCGGTECLAIFFFTMPFLNSVTYSVGALIGLLSASRKPDREESDDAFPTLKLS